ncbi:MAG TPA: ABC transporter permease [Bryobacteraceae bacterium]|nr:ABC transporter permease [Bryobacteraceae bacterium]
MSRLLSDLRYAVRTLLRAPGFAVVSVLTLALGIGANIAIFTIFDSVVLRPLPYRDPARLVAIQQVIPRFAHIAPNLPVNAMSFLEWRKQSRSFDRMAMFGESLTNLTSQGDPVRITMARASAALFPTLGIRPQIGRTFTEDEDRPGNDRVVVLSDRLWNDRFQRNPAVLGSKILLDGNPYEVIGVMPAGFEVPRTSQLQAAMVSDDYAQLWKPFGLKDSEIEPLGDFDFGCIARLKTGVSLSQAHAELNVIQTNLAKGYPQKVEVLVSLVPLQQQISGRSRQSLVLLLAAVGAVLLIVCVNIANLLLARAAGRRREMAIRTALGARTGRLVRQTLTESLLLASAGGALGILLGVGALRAILLRSGVDLPRISAVHMDGMVVVFAILVTLASGAIFGALPAWRMARTDPQSALKSGSRAITEGRGGLRRALIACEVALSAMCLAMGGLLLDSFVRVLQVDKGFQTERAVTVKLGLPNLRYPKGTDTSRFVHALLDGVRAQPGVVLVGESNMLPLDGEGNNNIVAAEGTNPPLVERPLVDFRSANPDFFRSMGIPLLAGRIFRESDGDRPVAVISTSLARRLWPKADPIGKRFARGLAEKGDTWFEVVGMVGDVRGVSLQKTPNPTAYVPYWQQNQHSVTLVVQTAMEPTSIASAVRGVIQALDRELPIERFQTLDQLVDNSVAQRRFQLDLVLLFAIAALLAAAVGVYGVISQSVAQRTNEIGIRMALGASAGSVWRMVLRQGLVPVVAGLAAGLAGSLAAGRLVSGLLYGVEAADPLVLAAVAFVLLASATAACWLPARRATRVNPLVALRYE